MLMFGDIKISYLFDEYSPASGDFVPWTRGPKALDPVEAQPGPSCALARSPAHTMTVQS